MDDSGFSINFISNFSSLESSKINAVSSSGTSERGGDNMDGSQEKKKEKTHNIENKF